MIVAFVGAVASAVMLSGVVLRQQEEVRSLKREVAHLKAKLDTQGRRLVTLSRLGKVSPVAQPDQAAHFFAAYDMTYQGSEVVRFWIRVPDRLSLSGKLRLVSQTLEYVRFHPQHIEILRIERRGGKRVAVINLRDSNSENTWYGMYFQGSTGGGMTTIALTQTFLQKGYKGEWIDGVQFYLNGEPLVDQDHTALGGTMYRDGTRTE